MKNVYKLIFRNQFFFSLDIQFLKRRWALWCISEQNKTDRSKLKNDEIMFNIKRMWKPCIDNPKIIMNENVSSV